MIGAVLRYLTAGESHGRGLVVIVEGLPAGVPVSRDGIAGELARRRHGYGRGGRQRFEADAFEIQAGVRHGRTIGAPVAIMIPNVEFEQKYAELMAAEGVHDRSKEVTRPRPGHADLAGALKYGFDDVRNVLERASARETAARVAAGGGARPLSAVPRGGVARPFLRVLGIEAWSFTAEVGGVALDPANATRSRAEADASPLRCPDPDAEARMIARIDEARSNGDTVGGVFEVVVHGAPIGLGSYVQWDRRLDAALPAAVMSINIVKGVEIGLGFEQARRFGSQIHDVIDGRREDGTWIHRTNNTGGLTGGVTNG